MNALEWINQKQDLLEEFNKLTDFQKKVFISEVEDGLIIEEAVPDIIRLFNKVESMKYKMVSKEMNSLMKKYNITKPTSAKAKAMLHNKYHRLHLGYDHNGDNLGFLIYVMGNKGVFIKEMISARTNKCNIMFYAHRTPDGLIITIFQSHLLHRYGERADIPDGTLNQKIDWLLKETVNSQVDINTDDVSMSILDNVRKTGHFAIETNLHIATGTLLGKTYPWDSNGISAVVFYKTFISTDLFNKSQDKAHQEAWDSIYEEIKNSRNSLPLV